MGDGPIFIFDSTPGVVGAVVTGQALPFAVAIGDGVLTPRFPYYRIARAVLTGFQVGGQSGLGVAHTLRDRIYVYVFGERAGEAVISGIAFAGVCDPPDGGPWTGFDTMYSYYEQVRASTNGFPVRLVFGPNTTLVGFMYEFGFNLEDPQTGVGTFAFKFKIMPRNAEFGVRPAAPWLTGGLSIPIIPPDDDPVLVTEPEDPGVDPGDEVGGGT